MPNCLASLLKENRFADWFFNPPLPDWPTTARPGSEEKVRVLARRYERGVDLHHPHDICCLDDDGSD